MPNTTYSYNRLHQKLQEVFALQPTDLGSRRLTMLYKGITSRLKTMPFLYVIPFAVFATIAAYLILGHLLVKLTSLLQYGF